MKRQPQGRTPGRSRLLVGALWLLTLIGATTMVAVWFIANAAAARPGPATDALLFVVLAIDALAFATMGALIVVRQPDNRIGWLLSLVGVTIVGAFNGFGVAAWRVAEFGRDDLLGGMFAMLGLISIIVLPALIGGVALLFPNGRVLSRRWAYAAALPFSGVILAIVSVVVLPEWDPGIPRNPIGIHHPLVDALRPLLAYGTVGSIATLGVGAPALIWRFIGSTGEVRQQMKWFAAAVALTLTTQVIEQVVVPGSAVASLVTAAVIALLPVSIGLGVLRYRLYAIDRIISRTLGWAAITGILGTIFMVGLIGLQAAMSGVTQSDTIAVAASTLVAFAMFQPIRRRVQAAVDRRFDRGRYDAAKVVDRFAERLRDQLDLQTIGREIEQAAATTVRPTSVAVWLRNPGDRP